MRAPPPWLSEQGVNMLPLSQRVLHRRRPESVARGLVWCRDGHEPRGADDALGAGRVEPLWGGALGLRDEPAERVQLLEGRRGAREAV